MKRVIVAYENKIAMEETLETALSRIFGVTEKTDQSFNSAQDKSTTDQPTKDLFKQAQELYDEAIRSQKEGDWARYGETIKRLGEILRRR
ncbi:MAG: hypothetical protein Athens101426_677 [Parcubacteria group bacterium Athens1014_26]|nr:MAG: hypothetical protein Athens101426_677 [Parcubacteria group bacterium Athens1014_26]